MGAPEISKFLTWLAVDRRVSASTQNQALSREEIGALLKQLTGTERLVVMLLYGSRRRQARQ